MVNFDFDSLSNTLHCRFTGRLDTENTAHIATDVIAKITDHSGGDPEQAFKVIFDIAQVDYIASGFIRVCLQSVRVTKKDNFSIINASPMIKKTFKIAGLDAELNVS